MIFQVLIRVASQVRCSGKESSCQRRRGKRQVFGPWVGKAPWSRKWQPTPVFLPGKFHGQRSLGGATVHRFTKSQIRLSYWAQLLQEAGPLPGPETGLLSNAWKWIVWGDTYADKARDFIGKGHPGGEQEGKGTQENCSATWLAVLGFMVMGLISWWSLANHSNSESFLVAHASLSQDGC